MTIEEKAKAYDEALKRAREIKRTYPQDKVCETIFPELKESEDEKIRNQIINFIEEYGNPIHCEWQKDWIAWLEKQAEVVSDKDDIEAEEKGIRKAFNKIWEEKQDKQKSQRMISAEAKEAMYNKPADTVEPKCEESKTKIFDAPTPFEDKLYAFVSACEILVDSSKREFILEHSQEILDEAREQIRKEQSSAWSEEDRKMINKLMAVVKLYYVIDDDLDKQRCLSWLKSLKQRTEE